MPIPSDEVTTYLGLGWFIYDHHASGQRYLQHTGLTNAQSAMLRVFPDQQTCFAVLLNSHKAGVLDSIGRELTSITAGIEVGTSAEMSASVTLRKDVLSAYQGHYQAFIGDYHIALGPEGLTGTFNNAVDEEPSSKIALRPLGDHNFDVLSYQGAFMGKMRFMDVDDDGIPQQLFAGVRLYQRVS